jgi:methionyl-tRNA synthetase
LFDQAFIYKADYTGWYCTFDERFWTDKDIESGLCPDCRRPVEKLSEHNYFFTMGRFQDRLIRHIHEHPEFIGPPSRRNEVLGFLQSQRLGDLSISRPKARLSWGIELPFDRDYVTYVWFDALVNYISALEYLPNDRPAGRKFWPADVHLIGKDILTTHAVYWSTMLMALDLPLPKTIFAHGWWTVNGEKMSKSRGNVVNPYAMVEKYGADAFRYFLLREVPFGQDGDFSEAALIGRINSDLANGLGNLLSRTLTMLERYCGGKIPAAHTDHSDEHTGTLEHAVKESACQIEEWLSSFQFHRALESIWNIIQAADQYVETEQPWKLAKDPTKKRWLEQVLYQLAETLRHIAYQLSPFMPHTAQEVLRQSGMVEPDTHVFDPLRWERAISGTEIKKGSPLFPRIETQPQGDKTVSDTPGSLHPTAPPATTPPAAPKTTAPPITSPGQTIAAPTQITIDEFMKVQLKTAKIVSAERVPKSEKLIKLMVSLGPEQRQIVAGIGKKYEPEALIGKTIVIVANLKPAKLMGIESQGMVLAAGDTEVAGLVTVLEDIEPGIKVK